MDLLKGSLQTFLNAFTYPDRTCYPVASMNVKDFYNLVDVYLDAVFCKCNAMLSLCPDLTGMVSDPLSYLISYTTCLYMCTQLTP